MARVRIPGCGCSAYFPVGLRAYHSRFCLVRPGQPLSPEELEAWNRAKRAHGPQPAEATEPARPPLLREDEGYVDHWLDRDD